MPKNWVYEPCISDYDALLFYNAMKRHEAPFHYIPVAVAMREETGMKYRFLCIARTKNDPEQASHFTIIEIYKPNAGMPYATCLHRLDADLW